MKKFIVVLITLVLICTAIPAMAEDKVLDVNIDSTTIALDKNGREYVRFIITEPRTLNGVQYNRSLPVMAFGDLVPKAKAYKAGDQLKAVGAFDSNYESYRILTFIE